MNIKDPKFTFVPFQGLGDITEKGFFKGDARRVREKSKVPSPVVENP
jgi:hypothetical protein